MATIEPNRVVVCDAGPLIHLDELCCLDLLADFAAILVPGTVWEEVQRHRPSALGSAQCRLERRDAARAPTLQLEAITTAFLLDAGEQAALLLLQEEPAAILLTDDTAARLAAKALGYRAHGTLGILIRAVRRRQRSREQVLALLMALPERSTLHVRTDLLQQIIAEVGSPP
jgi:predicted nucleic acid-binding protein